MVVHRAQARLDSERERPIPTESHRRLVTAFRTAADTGNLEELLRLLIPEERVYRLTPPSRRPAGPAHVPARHAA
ncbi:hypothetical protein AB0D65_31900 [Streptomyces griseoloalbus]|uniref:Uncharacterized protein n=1 Tax=Streptomyces griseoloalbus TaxID=67303 RepID=A0ABV3EEB5_9ACTN